MRYPIMARLLAAGMVTVLAGGAQAQDILRKSAEGDVTTTTDALEAAVTGAGATVFARVDHTAGAASVDMEMTEAQLLIFGNPRLGTPAMQDDPLSGLYLPLRVLVYRDGAGQVWLAYDDPAVTLTALDGIGADAPYLERMQGALNSLTSAATGG